MIWFRVGVLKQYQGEKQGIWQNISTDCRGMPTECREMPPSTKWIPERLWGGIPRQEARYFCLYTRFRRLILPLSPMFTKLSSWHIGSAHAFVIFAVGSTPGATASTFNECDQGWDAMRCHNSGQFFFFNKFCLMSLHYACYMISGH